MKGFVTAVGAFLCASGAFAETFTVKSSVSGTEFDWTAGANYVGEPANGPARGDTIVIPDGVTAIVDAAASQLNGTCGICDIRIDAGGTLQVYASGVARTKIYVRTISGSGRVLQPDPSLTYDLTIQEDCTFDGKFVGALNFRIAKTFTLTDAEQGELKGSPILQENGRFRLARFSMNGKNIVGSGSFNMGAKSVIEYVGGPDISGEMISAAIWGGTDCIFDAGAYGAFTYNGKLGADSKLWNLLLTGANANEAVFAGYKDGSDGKMAPASIAKEGTGTWYAKEDSRSKCGSVFEVREGTLRYDNLAPIGVNCSLGLANDLYRFGATAATEANRANYAILLGGETTEGFLQAASLSESVISNFDRQVSLRSAGGLKSGPARVHFYGITAASAGEKTLILDGDSQGYDTVEAVTNGAGVVSVEKRGSGTWTLRPPCDITGKIAVKGGRLNIGSAPHNPTYDWYRLRLKCNAFQDPAFADEAKLCYETKGEKPAVLAENNKRRMAVSEFMFFDAAGNRRCIYPMRHFKKGVDFNPQTGKIAEDTSYIAAQATNECALLCQPGRFALESVADRSVFTSWQRAFCALFEGGADTTDAAYAAGTFHYNDWFDRTFSHKLDINDESTWVSLVLRLESGSAPLVACDYCPQDTDGTQWVGRVLTAFEVDGSTDGANWDKLADFHLQELPTTTRSVCGTGASYSTRTLSADNLAKCVQFARTGPVQTGAPLELAAAVSVEPGATLACLGDVTLSKVALSAAGMGTLEGDGLVLAEEGTFVVPKLASGVAKATYPTSLASLGGASALGRWTAVSEDGRQMCVLGYDPETGDVTVGRPGLTIVIR